MVEMPVKVKRSLPLKAVFFWKHISSHCVPQLESTHCKIKTSCRRSVRVKIDLVELEVLQSCFHWTWKWWRLHHLLLYSVHRRRGFFYIWQQKLTILFDRRWGIEAAELISLWIVDIIPALVGYQITGDHISLIHKHVHIQKREQRVCYFKCWTT